MSYDFTKYYGKISNSGHDQRGKYKGGAAGDQTGTEWQIINWYNRPWNCVLRYPNSAVGQKLAQLSIKAALNNMIGYDQNQRTTYWSQLKKVNYDPSQITVACEADCSAGVIANTKAVGHLLGLTNLSNIGATYTGDMRKTYKAAGFTIYTTVAYTNGYTNLQPGDILLNDAYHVAVYIGKKAGIIQNVVNNITNSTTIQTAQNYSKDVAKTYVVNAAGGLNMRRGAGATYSILTTIPNGTSVTCYGYYNVDNNVKWLYIKYNNYIGYVSSQYLKEATTTSSAAITYPFIGECTGNGVAVRTWAGTNYSMIKSWPTLNKGNKVDVLKSVKATDGKEWYYVKIANKYNGFVYGDYIKKI